MGVLIRQVGRKRTRWICLLPLMSFGVIGILFFFIFCIPLFMITLSYNGESLAVNAEQWEISSGFPREAKPYLSIYQEAGKKYGVPWHVLAAIHKVETDFGRDLRVSSVGAKGQMQFMDKTWLGWKYPGGTLKGDLPDTVDMTRPAQIQRYGGYGLDASGDGKADPYNPKDAIHSAAQFLAKHHRKGEGWFDRGGAIWRYNQDYERYVLKVKRYAEAFAHPVISSKASFIWPVAGGQVTSPFGERFHPIHKSWIHHDGVDIAKEQGAPISASQGGYVVESRPSIGYGWVIVIDHVNGFKTLYAHMQPQDVRVTVGQKVERGQVIALVGNNGWSTGPHLHFEVYKDKQLVDPGKVLPYK